MWVLISNLNIDGYTMIITNDSIHFIFPFWLLNNICDSCERQQLFNVNVTALEANPTTLVELVVPEVEKAYSRIPYPFPSRCFVHPQTLPTAPPLPNHPRTTPNNDVTENPPLYKTSNHLGVLIYGYHGCISQNLTIGQLVLNVRNKLTMLWLQY